MNIGDRTSPLPGDARGGAWSTSDPAWRDPVVVVEVPDEDAGLSLVDHLARLHAELRPVDDTRCAVRIELPERTLEALIDLFKRLRRWQSRNGVRTLRPTATQA
jgi:hypothetical protein